MPDSNDLLQIKFTDLLHYAIKWRKPLLILAIAAIVFSAVLSFMIKPKYKAEVIFYPTTINSIGNALFTI